MYFKLCSTSFSRSSKTFIIRSHSFLAFPCPQESPCSSLEHEPRTIYEQAESFIPLCCLICLGCFSLCCLLGKLLYNLQDPYVNFSVKSSLPASQSCIFLLSAPTTFCRLLHHDLLDLTVLVKMSVFLYGPWLFPGFDSVPSNGTGIQEVLGKPFHFICFIPHPIPKPNDLKLFMVM